MTTDDKSTVQGRMKGAPLKIRTFVGTVKLAEEARYGTFETSNHEMTTERAKILFLEKVGRIIAKNPEILLKIVKFEERTDV